MQMSVAIAPKPAEMVKPEHAESKPARKKLVRRTSRDYSRLTRTCVQFAFLALNIWLGANFYFWVRSFETGPGSAPGLRPAGVEGWLPIFGLMSLKYTLLTGRVAAVHPAAMFLLVAFVAISFLFRKAFCSWLCPVGTLSEYLWRLGARLFGRNFRLPRWLDLPLRSLKHLLLAFFLWAVGGMSAAAIAGFMRSPYALIADIKMLNFFRHLSTTGAIVIGVLVLASLFVQNFWCRYLCPYGALLGIASLTSPLRIRRNQTSCIDCAKCAKVCPSALPVDKLVTIKSAECTACLECVAVCPADGTLQMSLPLLGGDPQKRRIPAWAMAAGITIVFLGIVSYAKLTHQWQTNLSPYVYQQLVPHADRAVHPMPGDN
jgi:polyferredoxin